MKRTIMILMLSLIIVISGCESFRGAASEQLKQNAWLHNRTAQLAADIARNENASANLQGLTALSAKQSQVFIADAGLPKTLPDADNVEGILTQENFEFAEAALVDAQDRPDVWAVADGVLNFGIAIAALFGGAAGVRIATGLKTARQKAQALKEVVDANELFKALHPESAENFKNAQADKQSPSTRNIVATMK